MRDLLIVFTDGEAKTIKGVSDYGFHSVLQYFYFIKNEYRSFVPKENVKFFGRELDWENY